jgi:hypothetical protein
MLWQVLRAGGASGDDGGLSVLVLLESWTRRRRREGDAWHMWGRRRVRLEEEVISIQWKDVHTCGSATTADEEAATLGR